MSIRCALCGYVSEGTPRAAGSTRQESVSVEAEQICPRCGHRSDGDAFDETLLYQPDLRDRTGTRLSHFVLTHRLGAGTFGEVWLADDTTLGRQVALKLPKFPGVDAQLSLNEARTAAALRHEHIVRVLEVGHDGQQLFIASEYIDGLTLQQFLAQGRPAVARVLELMIIIADALDFAHRAGVIHRDIKPANILLDHAGVPYVADFGIAKRINADATISQEGQIIGTAKYMSPEQASGKSRDTDSRSDLYALGVMLFEMLTGEVPFRGNVQAILHQKVVEDAPTPRTLNQTVSKDLETICLKCLEREPGRRYPSAAALAAELRRVRDGEPILARPITRAERAWRWCHRRPVVAGLMASLFLSLSLGLSGVTYYWLRAEDRAAAVRRSLYRSWMNLSAMYANNGDYTGVNQLLARVADDPEMSRLRGFEWNYYQALTAPMQLVANQGEAVQDVALSRDGDLCASIALGSGIHVWDSDTGEEVRLLRVEKVPFQAVEFSPTALLLASGSGDGYVRIWQPTQHDRALQQFEHGPPVILVRFAPQGDRVASAGKKGAVRIWNVNTGERLAEIPTGKGGETRDVRFAPNGRELYVATADGHVRVWNLEKSVANPTLVREFDICEMLECLTVSDDGETLLAGNYFGHLVAYSLSSSTSETYHSRWKRIDDVEFVKGTRTVLAVANDWKLHVFDLDQKHESRTVSAHGLATGILSRSADGSAIAIGSGDGSVTRIKLTSLREPQVLWHEQPVRSASTIADGRELVAINEQGRVRRWTLETGASRELLIDPEHHFRRLASQPQGSLLAFAGIAGTVALWDHQQEKMIHEISVTATGAVAVEFSPDGQRLALATRKGRLAVYQTGHWDRPLFESEPVDAIVNALRFSPDGGTLAVAWDNRRLQGLDSATGRDRWAARDLSSEPLALAFVGGGQELAIGTAIGEIHLWNVATRQTRAIIKGHTGRINAMTLLPDGHTLVSGGFDRQLNLWDLTSGELIAPLLGHTRQIFAMALSPDGRTLYSGDLEGEIRVWRSLPARD